MNYLELSFRKSLYTFLCPIRWVLIIIISFLCFVLAWLKLQLQLGSPTKRRAPSSAGGSFRMQLPQLPTGPKASCCDSLLSFVSLLLSSPSSLSSQIRSMLQLWLQSWLFRQPPSPSGSMGLWVSRSPSPSPSQAQSPSGSLPPICSAVWARRSTN